MTDKFENYGRMPTDYESELLTILMEECAEVQIRVSKMIRFGIDETQPEQPFDNKVRLSHELGDLTAVLSECIDMDLVDEDVIQKQIPIKIAKLKLFMQHRK